MVYGIKMRGYDCDPREMQSIINAIVPGSPSSVNRSNEFTNFSENDHQAQGSIRGTPNLSILNINNSKADTSGLNKSAYSLEET